MKNAGGPTTLDRRRMLQLGAGGAAGLVLAGPAARAAASEGDEELFAAAIEPAAGTWHTWIVPASTNFGVGKPPNSGATQRELDQLEAFAAGRSADVLARIAYWDAGSPGYRWNELAIETGRTEGILLMAYRMLALLNVAINDATVAVWALKYRYNRQRPGVKKKKLSTAIPTPASPSYPSEHAATAAAASTVLAGLFPGHAPRFAGLAQEHIQSRLDAGVEYPSDAAAGALIGRYVGEQVLAWAGNDGSDNATLPTVPVGPGLWQGSAADLALPNMGSWATWALASGDEFRPGPPPAPGSAQRLNELAEVKNFPRGITGGAELNYWPGSPSGSPPPVSPPASRDNVAFHWAPVLHYLWFPELSQKIFEYRWDDNPVQAARAYALVSIASYDATVASWDAKFTYWTGRPIHFDPTIVTTLPTYPIPDYPSGHATTLGGTSRVLEHLFPADAASFAARADENALSRLYAGIHFRSASEVGVTLGRAVGDKVAAVGGLI